MIKDVGKSYHLYRWIQICVVKLVRKSKRKNGIYLSFLLMTDTCVACSKCKMWRSCNSTSLRKKNSEAFSWRLESHRGRMRGRRAAGQSGMGQSRMTRAGPQRKLHVEYKKLVHTRKFLHIFIYCPVKASEI